MRVGIFHFRAVTVAAAAALMAAASLCAHGQERREGIGGVREQDEAATRTANQLNAKVQQATNVGQGQVAGNADLLLRAGIMLDARIPNRMIVERVLPNSPAFSSGIRAGDVITRVNGNPVTSLAAAAQALVNGAGNRLALQIDRNGQSRQLNLMVAGIPAGTPMRTDFGAPVPQMGQNNPAAATIGGIPLSGTGAATTTPSGVTPGLGTTTAQSAGGQAIAAGQPLGVGQGTATAPGRTTQGSVQGTTVTPGTTGTQGAAGTQAAGTTAQLPLTTTGNPPILPGNPTSPTIPGNPTSPSLQVQPGGVSTAFPGLPTSVPGLPTSVPGLPTSVPGLPTAAQGQVPATIPSSQGTVNPAIGGGTNPTAPGVGTTGTGASPATSSQGTVNPSIGGGTTGATSGPAAGGAGATGSGATGTGGATATGAAATGGAAGTGGVNGSTGAGGAGTGGGTGGGTAGGAAAGGT